METNTDFKGACDGLRAIIKDTVTTLVAIRDAQQNATVPQIVSVANRGEEIANLTIALRHLEDAAMRVGKAIQANQGGESPLGGPSTPATPSTSTPPAPTSHGIAGSIQA